MAISVTNYIPGKPLNEQLERLGAPKAVSIDMAPMITGAPPLEIQVVEFKPLKIKNQIFNILLESRTAVERVQEGLHFYDKLTFTIKDQGNKVLYPEVSVDDIEEAIGRIFEKVTKKTKGFESV